jgi:hypothetical protein
MSGGLAAPLGNAGKPATTAPNIRVRGPTDAGSRHRLTQRVRSRTRATCISTSVSLFLSSLVLRPGIEGIVTRVKTASASKGAAWGPGACLDGGVNGVNGANLPLIYP